MSHPKYPLLFSPLDVNGMVLPNRIVLPAMVTRLPGEDGLVNQNTKDRYLRYAKGEPGMIVVEATAVHQVKSGELLRLYSDEFIPSHREMVKQIHAISPSKVSLQIIHFLKIARSGWRQTVEMLSTKDIKFIIQAYGETAARTREAGYDTVELHMAHAYTLSSFLSARNKRRDEYGGRTLESRMRLMSEVILEVRRQVGEDYPVGVRFNGEEFIKDGYALNDSTYIALRMAQLGLDYISVSAGGKFEDAIKKEGKPLDPYTGYSGDRSMPPAHFPRGVNVYLAESIKSFINAHGYNTPIITAGRITTPQMAEEILQTDQADLIGLARPQLVDSDWAKKVREGHEDKIIRCSYVNICKQLEENYKPVRCGNLWPREYLHAPEAPDDHDPPQWPTDGKLAVELRENGQLRLTWEKATDPQGMYGYDVFRSVNGGPFTHFTAVKKTSHLDEQALAGNQYAYFVRPFDLAGNRGPDSNIVEITVIPQFEVPPDREIELDGEVEAEAEGVNQL
jgi:2,4-dienoyl-CoA reductase-like NADH-dependent reductase (Old Yellow Enzyme family)